MNLLSTGRNITIIALLLSLLFHVSTVFYIFIQKTRPNLTTNTEQDHLREIIEQQQEQKQNKPWVETQARAGNFGAPVFFEDTLPDQEDIPQQKELSKIVEDDQKNTQTAQDVIEEKIENKQEIAPEIKEEATVRTEYAKNEIVVQETAKISQKTAVEQKRKPRPKRTPHKSIPIAQKPPLTLAQLTQGFLDHKKENAGSYGVSMLGMKRGIPSDEQMKYERYLQKLEWCLQNALRINDHKIPRFPVDGEMHLFFVLNRDGIIQELMIKKSSGNKLWDNFFLFIFEEGSSAFPPVPTYLPDPFRMTYIIPITVKMY